MPDDHNIDQQLRLMAHSSLERRAASLNVEAELTGFQRRVAGQPAEITLTPGREDHRRQHRQWFAVAAAGVLVLGGLVAVTFRGDDDSFVAPLPVDSRPAPTVSSATPTAAPTITTITAATAPEPEGASAEPATVVAGEVVTISPAGVVQRACRDIVTATLLDANAPLVGQIVDGRWVTPGSGDTDVTYPECEGTESDGSVSFVVPIEVPAGAYEMCLTEAGDRVACAGVRVAAAANQRSACVAEPQAPPSLVDGSPPGSATIESVGTARSARWGDPDSPLTVVQGLDALVDPQPLDDAVANGRAVTAGAMQALVIPVGDPPISEIMIALRDTTDACLRLYRVGPGLLLDEATELARKWVDALAAGDPVAGQGHVTVDAEYFARRFTNEPPTFAIDRFSADSRAAGSLTNEEVALLFTRHVLPDGSTLKLAGPRPDGRCINQPLTRTGGAGGASSAELTEARSFGVTPDGLVIIGRDVCPAGTRWGDPGTHWELIAFDPSAGDEPRILFTRDADPTQIQFDDGTVIIAMGEMLVDDISADGRYVAVRDLYHTETSKWHLIDLTAPGQLKLIDSSCPLAGDIVGQPRFIGDDIVVVARLCASLVTNAPSSADQIGSGDLRIEVVDLTPSVPDAAIVWHGSVSGLGPHGYSRTAGLSARLAADGTPWVIVTGGGDIETPSRSFVLHGGEHTEISRPGYDSFAFDPLDLIEPWDVVASE